MLSDNHICQLQSQKFKTKQQKYMETHLTGDNISVLYMLRPMLAEDSEMAYYFACEGYKYLRETGKCVESDFQNQYELMAVYAIAMSNLFFGYNLKSGKMSLYTSSIRILETMASQGLLKAKNKGAVNLDLENFRKVLVDSDRVRSSIKRGVLQVVRLDPEIRGNSVVFTGTVPRSQLDLDEDVLIASQSMDIAMQYLNEIMLHKTLKITMGDKVRVVTKSFDVLSAVYGADRAQFLVSLPFDYRVERFYVPHVGASMHSLGVTNIKLADIDKIEVVNGLDGIDFSEVKTDYSMAIDYYTDRVNSMSEEELRYLTDECLYREPELTGDTLQDIALSFIDKLYPQDVYDFMKEVGVVFDMNAYKNLRSKFGDMCLQTHIPNTLQDLDRLLRTGVFRVVIMNRRGTMSTIVCSNAISELTRIYGDSYYAKYESEGNRLRLLENVLKNNFEDWVPCATFDALCDKYCLAGVSTEVEVKVTQTNNNYPVREIRGILSVALYGIENKKTVVKQPNLVTVRRCDARPDFIGEIERFYVNLDLKSIVSIVRLSDCRR